MKKKLSAALLVVLALQLFTGISAAGVTRSVKITYFNDYYVQGASLKASSTTTETEACVASSFGNQYNINVELGGEDVELSVEIDSGAFANPHSSNTKYQIVAVIPVSNFVRFVLADTTGNNTIYCDCYDLVSSANGVQAYNPNWYNSYVSGNIAQSAGGMGTMSVTDSYERTYASTTDIYGDKYKEILIVRINFDIPATINSSTGGEFISALGIKEKYTEYTPYGGTKQKLAGNSLEINGGACRIATPKGEYIAYINTNFAGTKSGTGKVYVDFSVSLPGMPLTIGSSLSSSNVVDNGDSGIYTYSSTTSNKMMLARANWTSSRYRLTRQASVGELVDFYWLNAKINTDTSSMVLGSKMVTFKWEFRVYSNGNCNGVGVNSYLFEDTYSRSIYYTLTR